MSIFFSHLYTDLAVENIDTNQITDGVTHRVEEGEDYKIHFTEITNETGRRTLNKPIGKYICIESKSLRENDALAHEGIINVLSQVLSEITNLNENSAVLVVGLGNVRVTPDALGPKVSSKLLVTRHMKENLPSEIMQGVRPVSTITPGVMGITGIETMETVRGIVEHVKPDLVIAIDALAAREISRVNASIQVSNSGISPGAGINNHRKLLNEETLGVPVVAIGVPTVVSAATLINDSLNIILDGLIEETKDTHFYSTLKEIADEEKYELISRVLEPYGANMFVAPKEVDAVVERLSNVIANAINISMHKALSREDINRYMY